jgi:TolB-like protein
MGVVYAAHDERLDRAVAIKVIRPDALADDRARERFRNEARAAARVSHPRICPLFELDEDAGQPFLVMELLEGEPLSARLERGPMALAVALEIAQSMLDALAALHRRGIVHRDLKPANVFLTPDGLKLLDFGLAQALVTDQQTREISLTTPGTIVGTPQYMAPEQLFASAVDERADVFTAAAVIYEMLAGRPAFAGRGLAEVLHAVGYEDPPALPDTLARVDEVLRQALAKKPSERIARADVLATLLRDATSAPQAPVTRSRAPRTRFVALPLRVLRPDPDTDFLAFSVPDAVSVALTTLDSVVVRSPQAATVVGNSADVRAIGRELAVDVVLTGTILRAGAHVRVSAQLADAAAGTLIWSDVAQAPIADLFQLQDSLTERIVASLALPLSARDRQSLGRQAPASAEAYELYLRANQLMTDSMRWSDARELYEQAVTLDPTYAPAWARLGRARRVLAKYGGPSSIGLLAEAEAAFRRAFEIDPHLSIAHDLAAYVDAELGRAPDAMRRLLERAATRPTDPGILAGLVTTCRYSGLLDASLAAHRRASASDPSVRTSVTWTHLLLGDYPSAIATDRGSPPFGAFIARGLSGDTTAIEMLRQLAATAASPGQRLVAAAHGFALECRVDEALVAQNRLRASGFADPEGWYLSALLLARAGAEQDALQTLTGVVDGGYAGCVAALESDPIWTQYRGIPEFDALARRVRESAVHAREIFDASDGAGVLASGEVPRPIT